MTERNHAFDFLCGLCILRMMANHITGQCGFHDDGWWQGTLYWTYYFMSFFFFKAGYFNKTLSGPADWTQPERRARGRRFCADKARRLLAPYAAWGLVGCAVFFGMQVFLIRRYHQPIGTVEWAHLWQSGGTFGNTPLWFLLSFFAAYVAMHFIERVRGLHWAVLLFPAASWALWRAGNPVWLELGNVPMGVFFFFLGRVWRWALARMRRRNTLLISAGLVAAFCAGNVVAHGEYDMSHNEWTGSPVAAVANTALVLCGMSGVLLSLRMGRVPLINFVGQHSMVYFVAHFPMLVLYRFVHLAFGRSIVRRWDDWILLMLIVPLLCTLLVPYVERVPWLSGRFGRKAAATEADKTTNT